MINTNPTLKDYWNFITHNTDSTFEVRIKSYDWLKAVAEKLKIPYSKSGVYVNNNITLFKVIKLIRDKQTVWISVNSKRKSFSTNTKFKTFNGTDSGILEIKNIMIDIDRKTKGNLPATSDQKLKINKLADILIKDLKQVGVVSYMKIDSGNGIQIVIPIEPLWLPEQIYDEKTQTYILSDMVEKYKNLIRSTFGAMLMRKYNNHKTVQEYNAEIDASSFNIGRVMALHGSLNLKYELPILRRAFLIVQDESNPENKGLMYAMMKNLDDVVPATKYLNSKKYNIDIIGERKNYTSDTIYDSALVKLLLAGKLPDGDRNRSLIFPLKVLLQKNNIALNSPEAQKLKRQIEIVQQGSFPFNPVNGFSVFSTNTINKYCVNNFINLPYDVLPQYGVNIDMLSLINDTEYKHIFTFSNFFATVKMDDFDIKLNDKYNELFLLNKLTNSLYENLILLNKSVEQGWSIYNRDSSSVLNSFADFINYIYKLVYKMSKIYSEPQMKQIIEVYVPQFLSKQISM